MATPTAFDQFTLRRVHITENEFGRGSYAIVFEVQYQGLKCAGKKLYQVLYEAGISHAAQRFLEECRLLSQVRHPNIVQFLGVCFQEGSQFPILVMEFLPTNLTSCLEHYGILSDEISYSILHDVSLGLVYLHGQTPAIVHRDLSANNVLLSTNMTAKISDLGVARILNLTPLQVSRMTETPGTPAYMPPEVMVADPRYDTSVDVFSFGVMIIHTLTAEWPLPSIGPTRIDPVNPDEVIGVTEAERHQEFLRKISQEHPLIDLIMRCLNNNPQRRPGAMELVGIMGGVVMEHPPSFENRVEMLQRISSLLTDKRELEGEIARKEQTIMEKVGEIDVLNEEKRQQRAECENTTQCMHLLHSMETNRLKLENELLKADHKNQSDELSSKDTKIAILKAAIHSLNDQLTKTSEYLNSKPQLLQAQLCCSQCSNVPVDMIEGSAVIIKGKAYYGGGYFSSSPMGYRIHCYDPPKNEWSTLPNLPFRSLRLFGLGVIKDELVTVGGIQSSHSSISSRTNAVHVFTGKSWKNTIPPMPTARSELSLITLASHLIAAGGCLAPNNYTNIVEIYSINFSQWNKTNSLPYACRHQMGTVSNNTVYLVGGWDGKRLNKVLAAKMDELITNSEDLQNGRGDNSDRDSAWKEIASTPTYRPSVVTMSNTIFAIGGRESDGPSQTVRGIFAYSPSMNVWLYISDLPSPRAYSATVPMSLTECLIIGGREHNHPIVPGAEFGVSTVYKLQINNFIA